MSHLPAYLVLFLGSLVSTLVHAQVHASSSRPLFLSAYATASGSERELNFAHGLGGGGGFILEHSRLLAFDFRGEMLRARIPLHTYLAEAGPRVAFHYRRLQPYAEFMGGLGHSGYLNEAHQLTSALGLAWTVDAGLDLRVTSHLVWRVGEYSYNEIYAGTGAKRAIPDTYHEIYAATAEKPTLLNTGILYRF